MLYQHQLLVFLLIITSLFSLSNGSSSTTSSNHRFLAVTTNPGNNPPNYENVGGRELLMMTNRRVLVKYEPDLLLAKERTRRRDPTNHLKFYEGGWNISNSHYHWSTLYTGRLFYVIGIASFWVLAFIWCFSLICLCCCKGWKTNPTSNHHHTFSVISLTILTLIAIGGSIVVYWSVEEFYATTNEALSYMKNNSDEAAGRIRKVYTYLDQAGNVSLGRSGGGGDNQQQYNLSKDTQQDIEDSYWRYNYTVQRITNDSHDHIHKIHQIVDTVRYYLLFTPTAGLLIILVGFGASSRGYLVFIYILAIFGWMVVTGGLLESGLSMALYNEVGDTCLAMKEWVQKGPVEGTAMDELITCANVKAELRQTKMITQQLVSLIVNAINDIANGHSSSSSTQSFFSRRHKSNDPFLPLLCNPYYPDLSPRQCERGEVTFTNATQVWQNYVCKEVGAGGITCLTQGRLTPTFYNELNKAVNISSHLHKYTPFLTDLDKCNNLKTVLQHITCHYCPNITKYTRMFFIGLPFLSGAVMFSTILWLDYAKKRKYQMKDNYQPPAAQTIEEIKPPGQHHEAGVGVHDEAGVGVNH